MWFNEAMQKIHEVEAILREREWVGSVEQSRGEVRGSLDVVTFFEVEEGNPAR